MLRKIIMITAFCVAGWAGSAQAALIGTCTFSGGCGPDFFSTGNVDYTYHGGTGIGTLTLNTTVGNASFLPGHLDAAYGGGTSLPVLGSDPLTLSMVFDGSGNLLGGSLDFSGAVMYISGGLNPVYSANGTLLNGNLVANGTITQAGWDSNTIDFRGFTGAGSLLTTAGFTDHMAGVINLSNISTGSGDIVWNQSWTANNSSIDVVVPVPAAVWLFLSGLIGLVGVARKQA